VRRSSADDAAFDENRLAWYVAAILQATEKRSIWAGSYRTSGSQESYDWYLPSRLRRGGERHGEEAEGNSADEGSPIHYSMT
jgi:hypothetical protein